MDFKLRILGKEVGGERFTSGMREFSGFIMRNGLRESSLTRSCFTWFNLQVSPSIRKFDIFLLLVE